MAQLTLDLIGHPDLQLQDDSDMGKFKECKIVSVGKRRDGGTRYWCLEHRGDATAKYGKRGRKCRLAHIPPLSRADILDLDVGAFPGGVALWGAVPPIYDTTLQPLDRGIHVHAREAVGGDKKIDLTYRRVRVRDRTKPAMGRHEVSELDAIYYMVSSVFGYETKYVACTYCGYSHLDKDWFSVHGHRRHLCAGCGRHFRDEVTGIGNPVAQVRNVLGAVPSKRIPAPRSIRLKQSDYPGGVQIWGSNPAIYWNSCKAEEEGIHLHVFDEKGEIVEDNTYSAVVVDDEELDAAMVRTLMAQSALPHIQGRVVDAHCPKCKEPHFDSGEFAFTPHDEHLCQKCGEKFSSKGRLRRTIGNPMVGVLSRLALKAPRPPQAHDIGLVPETI